LLVNRLTTLESWGAGRFFCGGFSGTKKIMGIDLRLPIGIAMLFLLHRRGKRVAPQRPSSVY
jgi:hypothetical protein